VCTQELSKEGIALLSKSLADTRQLLLDQSAKPGAEDAKSAIDTKAIESALESLKAVIKEQQRVTTESDAEKSKMLADLLTEQRQLQATVQGMQTDVRELKSLRTAFDQLGKDVKLGYEDAAKVGAENKQLAQSMLDRVEEHTRKLQKLQADLSDSRLDAVKSHELLAAGIKQVGEFVVQEAQAGKEAKASGASSDTVLVQLVNRLQGSVDVLQTSMMSAFESATLHGFPSVAVMLPDNKGKAAKMAQKLDVYVGLHVVVTRSPPLHHTQCHFFDPF
jgi:hypothetical protein